MKPSPDEAEAIAIALRTVFARRVRPPSLFGIAPRGSEGWSTTARREAVAQSIASADPRRTRR